jgi:glutamate--cysteine ligase
VDGLVCTADEVLRDLFDAAECLGIRLITRGIDPVGEPSAAPLLVSSTRYRKQSAHYETIGPWGRRMMRQSVALHVNLDLGGRPVRRWGVANRMAPLLTAIFANSPRFQGRETGHRSFRAHQWRHVDPSRTGVFTSGDRPVPAYTSFALGALDFLGAEDGARARPFREAWLRGTSLEAWRAHLSTLFPEVRPRGYLELRSLDALRPAWLPVPVVLAVGALYDPAALSELETLLPEPSEESLEAAGRVGVRDAAVRERAADLFDVALAGARRLGNDVVGGRALEITQAFRVRFLDRGEDPGDEADTVDPFAL